MVIICVISLMLYILITRRFLSHVYLQPSLCTEQLSKQSLWIAINFQDMKLGKKLKPEALFKSDKKSPPF
jgi:hypothetical protein